MTGTHHHTDPIFSLNLASLWSLESLSWRAEGPGHCTPESRHCCLCLCYWVLVCHLLTSSPHHPRH
jgi:hypothetical protein